MIQEINNDANKKVKNVENMLKQVQDNLKDSKQYVNQITTTLEYLKNDFDKTKEKLRNIKEVHKKAIQSLEQQHQKEVDRTEKHHKKEVSLSKKKHKDEVQQLAQKMTDIQEESNMTENQMQLSINWHTSFSQKMNAQNDRMQLTITELVAKLEDMTTSYNMSSLNKRVLQRKIIRLQEENTSKDIKILLLKNNCPVRLLYYYH